MGLTGNFAVSYATAVLLLSVGWFIILFGILLSVLLFKDSIATALTGIGLTIAPWVLWHIMPILLSFLGVYMPTEGEFFTFWYALILLSVLWGPIYSGFKIHKFYTEKKARRLLENSEVVPNG